MQIDWFTFGAQILNFLLLIWLLKRFLYGPVIEAMDRREQQIQDRIQEADRRHDEAEEQAETYRERRAELDAKSEEMTSEAQRNAEQRRKEMIREARSEVAELESRWRESLNERRQSFMEELGNTVTDGAVSVARSVLRDLANADLHEQIFETFIDRLEALEPSEQETLSNACRGEQRLRVITSGELDENRRRRMTKALRTLVERDVEPEFVSGGRNLPGAEIRAGDFKLSWTTDDYLNRLNSHIREVLDRELSRLDEEHARVEEAA